MRKIIRESVFNTLESRVCICSCTLHMYNASRKNRLSYHRETRATLCISWNAGLLLYK